MKTSVFEIFKIGIGPSSSHTVGPMRAAHAFVSELECVRLLPATSRIQIDLFGSLALTGKGHATDRAIVLGLMGELPDTVDPATIESRFSAMLDTHELEFTPTHSIAFHVENDLRFRKGESLPGHPNAMKFSAFNSEGGLVASSVYYSVGGGFIRKEGEADLNSATQAVVPYPFSSANELLQLGEAHSLAIWQIALANEIARRPEIEVRSLLLRIWQTMEECIQRGLRTEGILPGGLRVRRRAFILHQKLTANPLPDPLAALDWVTAFAMAVNEENAAGGRVVTAPTNGAAGIIPAVGSYYRKFIPGASSEGILKYLLTAGAIGILYKENASISGAEVGCQGEVGVACSMAAGGLVAALGGNNRQVEAAAEIGMEHNLGMTCDPIGGLVQIPCIERNAMGAVKAISACRMAMNETGEHKVSLDQVIETMYRTGLDMQTRYKETSLGGLALNIIEC